jgi:adenylate kinase
VDKFRSILIFGPPGAGKGTISKLICSTGNLMHVSSGDIFRGLSADSPGGKLFNQYAHKGLLLPDIETITIWKSHMDEMIEQKRYFPEKQFLLLDGIPRTKEQAEEISKYIDVKHVILLHTDNTDDLIERLKKRSCKEGRSDDACEKVLNQRMEVYKKQTKDVLDFYPKNIIHSFNPLQPPLELFKDILNELATPLSKESQPLNL